MSDRRAITVRVRLHAVLRQHHPQPKAGPFSLTLGEGSPVSAVADHLQIALEPDTLLFVVNRELVTADHPLQDGDLVQLIPAISGGIPPIGMKTLM